MTTLTSPPKKPLEKMAALGKIFEDGVMEIANGSRVEISYKISYRGESYCLETSNDGELR